MSREILFRAKRLDNGEWVDGNLITNEKNESKKYIGYIFDEQNGVIEDFDIVEVIPSTICQYTGLTNELGEEFWENDIVQSGYYYGVIKYEDDAFIIKWNTKGSEFLRHDLAYWTYLCNARVVGNVFDNPELLEEENVHGTD